MVRPLDDRVLWAGLCSGRVGDFLGICKVPRMLGQNGHLPIALGKNSRKAMLRWAARETRRASIAQNRSYEVSEPRSKVNFEA